MSDFVSGNKIVLLRNGTEYFPALQQAIDAAQYEIHLQTYIFEDDAVGRAVAEALMRAAGRGVSACLLLDGFGCKEIPPAFVIELQTAGVEVLFYRPKISPWTLRRRRLRRLHRKVAVIDGRIAFVGGINIIDDMNAPDHMPPRVDYAVSVEGLLLAQIHASTRRLWRRTAWARLLRVDAGRLAGHVRPQAAGPMWAAYVVRDNIWHRRAIENVYLEAIDSARHEIVIANSYFLPGVRFRRALVGAARRGVRVVLLLQSRVEYVLLDYASRALYDQMLDAGVEIHEYQKSLMHSKVAVIDGHWATVGSSNIDPFSLLLAREANVVVEDAGFAGELRQDLERSIQNGASRVSQASWRHDHFGRRLVARLLYGLIRFFMGVVIGYPERR
ncbi:putative cardiolipin synthase YbhO [mine drainage metagenome]|uniref:Putative cardiolipin synthase YbhO n=1 Tax=mine drainage metagenome TaxID=410659 RepID=A0A1J5QI35_9ZZZZ